jgi:hypothetical protein
MGPNLRTESIPAVVVQLGIEEADDEPTASIVADKGEEKILAHLQHVDAFGLFLRRLSTKCVCGARDRDRTRQPQTHKLPNAWLWASELDEQRNQNIIIST